MDIIRVASSECTTSNPLVVFSSNIGHETAYPILEYVLIESSLLVEKGIVPLSTMFFSSMQQCLPTIRGADVGKREVVLGRRSWRGWLGLRFNSYPFGLDLNDDCLLMLSPRRKSKAHTRFAKVFLFPTYITFPSTK